MYEDSELNADLSDDEMVSPEPRAMKTGNSSTILCMLIDNVFAFGAGSRGSMSVVIPINFICSDCGGHNVSFISDITYQH